MSTIIVIDGDKNGGSASIAGKLHSSDDELTFTLDSYEKREGVVSDKQEIGIELTLTNSAVVPDMPEYKNICDLTADEYSDVIELVSLLMYSGYDNSFMYEYDPTYDYDYDGDVDDDDRQLFYDYVA